MSIVWVTWRPHTIVHPADEIHPCYSRIRTTVRASFEPHIPPPGDENDVIALLTSSNNRSVDSGRGYIHKIPSNKQTTWPRPYTFAVCSILTFAQTQTGNTAQILQGCIDEKPAVSTSIFVLQKYCLFSQRSLHIAWVTWLYLFMFLYTETNRWRKDTRSGSIGLREAVAGEFR